ncbi:serine threonine- phosphatase PGAM5, mitochondrial isoform X1, partial [Pelobates cultripes]
RASLAKQSGVRRYTEDKYEYHRKEDYKNKSNRHIFLIQHANHKTCTSSDKKLTAEGYEQADLTGKRLAKLSKGPGMAKKRRAIQFKHIIYSPQTTTRETAERISKHLPSVTMLSCDSLNEGPPIQTSQDPDWKPDLDHLETAFRKYIYRPDPEQAEDTYETMVCHADLIRYIVCKSLQLPLKAWSRMSLYHSSVTKLVVQQDGNVRLKMLGDAGFMPHNLLTKP